jgi:hypothetical protein
LKIAVKEDDPQWKMTSKIKSVISPQPMVGSSCLKIKTREPTKIENCLQGRQHSMGDDLKLLKGEYLSNPLLVSSSTFKLYYFQWKKTSKYQKWNRSATPHMGNPRGGLLYIKGVLPKMHCYIF